MLHRRFIAGVVEPCTETAPPVHPRCDAYLQKNMPIYIYIYPDILLEGTWGPNTISKHMFEHIVGGRHFEASLPKLWAVISHVCAATHMCVLGPLVLGLCVQS